MQTRSTQEADVFDRNVPEATTAGAYGQSRLTCRKSTSSVVLQVVVLAGTASKLRCAWFVLISLVMVIPVRSQGGIPTIVRIISYDDSVLYEYTRCQVYILKKQNAGTSTDNYRQNQIILRY